jgi:glyoxylase-like metal-dependent hydrolase (beta-lactamase superfamily II)
LLSDANNIIVVDLLRNSLEAEKLADRVASSGKKLNLILITHGHPDHYIGLGVFHRRFPTVIVKVASSKIRDDIISFSNWMESVGWLEAEAKMKVKSAQNPEGFDYSNLIEVLSEPFLRLPTECSHMTTLSIPEQRTFLAFDLLYNHVHAWCGPGVDQAEIRNWILVLDRIKRVASDGGWSFYCGHGERGDKRLVDGMKKYLETFVEVTSAAKTRQEAINRIKALFPGFAQEDFLLLHSVNFHVKETN